MMWKTLIILAVTSAVLAGNIKNKRHSEYEFHIKHDYEYLKHKKHHKHEIEEKPQEEEAEHKEEIKEEEQNEEAQSEPEEANESEASNAESEESKHEEEDESAGYEFLYKVIDPHTHDKKGQHEKKYDGEIKGVYWLLQPDGYKRTVDYHTDKHNGFHAKVDYSKAEEPSHEEENSHAKSDYYVKTYHGRKYIPIKEETEEEQDKQEESAQNIPIYVI